MGFLTGEIDDDDEDEDLYPKTSNHPPGLIPRGRPGPAVISPSYDVPPAKPNAAKIPNTLKSMVQPKPAATPIQVSFSNQAQPRMKAPPPAVLNLPQGKAPTPGPMSPHPLQPPKTPIMPAFARPKNNADASDVKFTDDAILRGNKEETLLARNTPKGAEFWRRFSVVVKEDQKHPGKLFKRWDFIHAKILISMSFQFMALQPSGAKFPFEPLCVDCSFSISCCKLLNNKKD